MSDSRSRETVGPGSELRIDFSREGNGDLFAGEGWSRGERVGRWAVGRKSVVTLPPIDFGGDIVITFKAKADCHFQAARPLAVKWNGHGVARFPVVGAVGIYAVQPPLAATARDRENILTFVTEEAETTGETDATASALFVRELRIERSAFDLAASPRLLDPAPPHTGRANCGALAQRFQSLGYNCEFGLFQRRCGVDPIGLLRFAAIRLDRLIEGVASRFAGIGSAENLSFDARGGDREYIGHHAIYGLDYHTFKTEGEIELEGYATSEARRLDYLARMLMEQMEGAEKIFVVQRRLPNLSLYEAIPLLRALRAYNADARLLWVTEGPPELHGRVERLGRGFFRAHIDRFAPGENAHDLSFERWLEICATAARASDDE